jgi:hypothetical protein
MADSVFPGPCLTGCPPATEIVCIETTKVYDFCYQVERKDNICFNLPEECNPSSGSVVTCEITDVACAEIDREPLEIGGGFYNVTLLVTVTSEIIITYGGSQVCCFSTTFSFTKTITLCAPDDISVNCEIPSYNCGPCFLAPNRQVCCTFTLCFLIQSYATVKLLVPSYGFCVPAECVKVSPEFPLECPPHHIYPPQCTLPTGSLVQQMAQQTQTKK